MRASGRLALAVLLVALVAVAVAVAVPAAVAVAGRRGAAGGAPGAAVDRAHAALAAAERARLARLELAARLLAREEALVEVLGGGAPGADDGGVDGAAALADLLAQRRPELGYDLALVLDPGGRVVAALDGSRPAAGADLAADPLVAAALAEGAAAGAWRTADGLAHAAVARVAPDFELIGHVLAGVAVDRVLALEVARASGAEVTFLAAGDDGAARPIATSLGDTVAAELTGAVSADGGRLADLLDAGGPRESAAGASLQPSRRVLAVPLASADGTPPGVALLSSPEGGGLAARALPLAAGAALGCVVALALAPLVARRALGPAGRLVEAVEAAPRESFARRLEPRRYRALGPLAAALDRLFRRLHEERSLAAAASGARRRRPAGTAPAAGTAATVAERGAVALFELRRHAAGGDDAAGAAAALAGDLETLRRTVAAAGGRLAASAGHRAVARFSGEDAAWRAVSAAAAALTALAADVETGDPAAAAVASGRLTRVPAAGAAGEALFGPAVQLAESVLRETAPDELAMTRAVHREVAERLAARGAAAGEQRGILSPQPLGVLSGAALAVAAAGTGAPPSAAAPAVGEPFAGRRVVARAGESAGAELWRVRDEADGGEAALKWLPGGDPERRREALGLDGPLAAVRRLDHPGLAAVEEVGEAAGGAYLVREWVDGVPLAALGELPPPAALALARQLAAALAAVHAAGLAHGRVKPENVIVEADGRVRLVDLGAAAVAGPAPSASAGERLLPPERQSELAAAGAGDPRSDVYALGALLHRLLLARWPGEPPPEGAAAAPPALADLLARATADDPAVRPADAGELAAALEAAAG